MLRPWPEKSGFIRFASSRMEEMKQQPSKTKELVLEHTLQSKKRFHQEDEENNEHIEGERDINNRYEIVQSTSEEEEIEDEEQSETTLPKNTNTSNQKDFQAENNASPSPAASVKNGKKQDFFLGEACLERYGQPPSSTIYLGGINGPGGRILSASKAQLTVTDIADLVQQHGRCKKSLLAIRLMPEKACCFVDFCDAADAVAFFACCYGGSSTLKEILAPKDQEELNQSSNNKASQEASKVGAEEEDKAEKEAFYKLRRITNVKGVELRVGWAAPTLKDTLASSPSLQLAVKLGATRCVYVHPVEEGAEPLLQKVFEPFGPVDNVRIRGDKAAAYVHLSSISLAMRAVSALRAVRRWKRVAFAVDRVCRRKASPPSESSGMNAKNTSLKQNTTNSSLDETKGEALQNRTVFLGNLHPKTTLAELCGVIRAGGPILSVRLVRKNSSTMAFVTFVEPVAAQNLYDFAATSPSGLVLHGKRAAVGWAKLSPNSAGPLSPHLQALVRTGATRCLCIPFLDQLDAHQLLYEQTKNNSNKNDGQELPNQRIVVPRITNEIYEGSLHRFFVNIDGMTGEEHLESITIGNHGPGSQRIAFINFGSIQEAAKALEAAQRDPRFNAPCCPFYGKDKCALPNPFILKRDLQRRQHGDSRVVVPPPVTYEDPLSFMQSTFEQPHQ